MLQYNRNFNSYAKTNRNFKFSPKLSACCIKLLLFLKTPRSHERDQQSATSTGCHPAKAQLRLFGHPSHHSHIRHPSNPNVCGFEKILTAFIIVQYTVQFYRLSSMTLRDISSLLIFLSRHPGPTSATSSRPR